MHPQHLPGRPRALAAGPRVAPGGRPRELPGRARRASRSLLARPARPPRTEGLGGRVTEHASC
eukprot:5298091-Pyramimonas_sp.AAC.1